MARRHVVLLLLAAAAVLSNVPSTALASSSSSSSPTTGDEQQQAPPPPPPSNSDAKEDPEQQKQKQKQKDKERQVAKEKAAEEEKVAQQELLKFAEEKHLVSPTHGAGWYKGIAREFVDAHNELRARFGVTPMKWDRKLARQARRWSNAMRKDCQMLHSSGPHKYGQSVFRSHDNWNATAKDAVDEWGKEEAIYDRQKEKCLDGRTFKECGHFALMVGKRSTKVGCARSECFKGGVFITCNYYASDLKDKDDDDDKNKSN